MEKNKIPLLERMASKATHAAGSNIAILISFLMVVVWLFLGPVFNYSDTWQLVINTSTTIVTFLVVFLIQKTQNKDSVALHIKLNELIAAHEKASNRIVAVEDLSEKELAILEEFYEKLAELSKKEREIHQSHSIDEAMKNHSAKKR
ncbi:low affinity iron permease family protein [Solitalea longa]|uniref:Low affinity iron permease family protein n=1 Tax=Solitalea longa TaxID=2079460 RepID=A0A2S5A046_9SPHI|nr:low affinity iron permease family protein [Solitalea longa]POY35936.1 low affinity iron permease family protein [Solitalea longa]